MTISLEEQKHIVSRIFAGASFRLISFGLTMVLQLARVVIFARLFLPSDIGTVALSYSCVTVASLLGDFGFYQSTIIRKTDEGNSYANTAYTSSLIISVSLFALVLAGAPIFSSVFSADLDNSIRFLAILVFKIPFRYPTVFREKALKFELTAIGNLVLELTILLATVLAELIAHLGIWSLLIGYVAGFILSALYIWVFASIRPRLYIDRKFLKSMFGYGTPLMVQGLNGEVWTRGDNLMVGAYYGASQLAYYNFAWQLPMMISALASTIDSMLFPVFARLNNQEEAIKKLFNLANKGWAMTGSFFGFPIILYADTIVDYLYGPNWQPVVPIVQVMALSFIIRFCSGYSYGNLALVRSRSQYLMKWGFVNTILVFTLCLFMIRTLGPIGGAWYWVLQVTFLNPFLRFPLIYQELGSLEFLHEVWQPVLSGLIASLVAYFLTQILGPSLLTSLFVSVFAYFCVYMGVLTFVDRGLLVDLRKGISLVRGEDRAFS